MKLFISYSRDDKNYVYELAQALKDRSQHDVWIDRRLVAADLWWDSILDNIEACECFVTLLTPKSVSSIYCNAELDYALALQKPILPLMLKSCDMPAPLRKIQCPDISGISLSDALLTCTQALYEVRIRRIEGKYPAPERVSGRPAVPTPPVNSEHISDVYADAEEAAAEGNESLAEKLFRDVIAADPQGFGLVASERLAELHQEHKRAQDYNSITRLMANPNTLKGAKSAWKFYVQTYGLDYDPNGYAAKLASHDTSPIIVPSSIVEVKPPVSRPPPPLPEVSSEKPSKPDRKTPISRTPPIKPLIVGGVVIALVVIIGVITRQPPGNTSSLSITGTSVANIIPPGNTSSPSPTATNTSIPKPSLSPTETLIGNTPEPSLSAQSPLMTFSGHTDAVIGVAFSPDGKEVLTGSFDGTAKLWDVQSGKTLQTFTDYSDNVKSVAFSPDGKYVLAGNSGGTAELWDVQSGKTFQTFNNHVGSVNSVTFSPDGKEVLTANSDGIEELWDVQNGTVLQTFTGHSSTVYSVAFSPDGKSMLTGSGDGTTRLWDVQSGTVQKNFSGHYNIVYSVAFSPDGKSVLTGSADGTAKLWDAQSGTVLQVFIGHTDTVTSVAFSPDGKYVLTGGTDGTAKLWDVQSGTVQKNFDGGIRWVFSVAFSPDGKYILTGSGDGTAKLWASGISQ